MSRLLAQSINVAGLVDGQRNGHQQRKGSGKSTRSSVKTKCHTLGASGLRMSGFSSGLRTVNDPLDTNTIMLRPLQAFYSRRPSKWVAKALSEKFTDEAFKVLMLAQVEAKRLGHTYVGTEQILLGLIGEGTGIASKVLKSKIGIKLKDARLQVEKIIGRGYGYVGVEIPFTPQAKHVLKLSLQEARQLEDDYIGSEHLLLSLLNEREGVAARVLQKLGADPADIRIQIYREIVSGSKW